MKYLHIDVQNGVVEISRRDYDAYVDDGMEAIDLTEEDCVYDLTHFSSEEAVAKVSQETFNIIDEEFGVN